jgi:putative inorganic carbon (hco3(-)) transporter
MLNPVLPYFYLLAYVVVLYVRPQEYLPEFVGSPIVPALLGFVAFFWLVAQKKNFEAPQHRLMPCLALAMFISVAMSGWMGGAVGTVVIFVPTMLLFYLIATSVDSIQRFRDMCFVLTVICCVLAVHGAEQAAAEEGIGWTGAKMIEGRITYLGFLNDPNDLAMAFLMTLPMTLYLASTSGSFIFRYAYRGAAALILYGVYLCNSRGSLLAIGAMLFVYSVGRFGWVRSVIVAPMLGLPLVFLAPSRLGEISADEDSAAGRVDAWYEGLEMLRSHPVFGVGAGLFTDHHPLTAHNSFVLAIAELGVFGYFFWLAIVVFSVLMLYQLLRAERPAAPRAEPVDSDTADTADTAGAADTAVSADAAHWDAWQRASRALMYSLVGTLVAAFFLSRTYAPNLYLLVGLIVAVHQTVRSHWPALAPFSIGKQFKALIMLEAASIVGLWLTTKVLLSFS